MTAEKKFIFNISIDWLLVYSMNFRFTPQSLSRLLHFLHINNKKKMACSIIFTVKQFMIEMATFRWENSLENEMLSIFRINYYVQLNNGVSMAHDVVAGWRQRDGRFGFYVMCQISNCIAWHVNIQFEMKSACFHLVIAQFGQFAS